MSLESQIGNALQGLVEGRIFPDVAPEGTARPYIVYQQVGGSAFNYVEGGLVGLRNARVQISVWADARIQASQIGDQAEAILLGVAGLQPQVLGAASSIYEPDTGLRGRMQDFSFHY